MPKKTKSYPVTDALATHVNDCRVCRPHQGHMPLGMCSVGIDLFNHIEDDLDPEYDSLHQLMQYAFSNGLLALDPGLQGTGLAYWTPDDAYKDKGTPTHVAVMTIPSRHAKEDWWERVRILSDLIYGQLQRWEFKGIQSNVVMEMTEYQASAASRVMTWKTGDLQRLTYLVGALAEAARPRHVLPIVTSGWKGQLPKHLVQQRITKRLGLETCERLGIKTHAWDAVGIGLWYLDRVREPHGQD